MVRAAAARLRQAQRLALAWFTGRLGGHEFRCHAGGGPRSGAEIRVYPALGAASMLVTNTTIVRDLRLLDPHSLG